MSFIVRTLFPIRCMAYRHAGPHNTVYQTWHRMKREMEADGYWPPPMRTLSIYPIPEAGVPAEEFVSYAACEIPPKFTPPPQFEIIEVPGGEYIGYIHTGPPESLENVWHWFWQNAGQAAGRPVAMSMFFESYFGDPTVDGEELGTELNLLLEPAPALAKKPGLFDKRFGR